MLNGATGYWYMGRAIYVTHVRVFQTFIASVYPQKRGSQPRTSRWSLRRVQ